MRRPIRLQVPAEANLPAILLVVLGALLPLGWQLFAGTVPFEDDLQNYFLPVMTVVADRLRGGQLPLWTDAIFTGFPLFADSEAGTLFPTNWIMVVVPGAAGLQLVVAIAVATAALGMYVFERRLGLDRVPSIIGSWAFALGGFVTGHQIHISLLHGASLLPFVLATLDAAVEANGRRAARWLVAAGILHALQWLAGHAQAPMLTWLLAGAFLTYRLLVRGDQRTDGRGRYKRLSRLIAYPATIGLLAFGLAAVQLLPSIELAGQSARASRVDYEFAKSYAVSPFDIVSLVFPFFFQQNGVRWSLWALWETSGYLGILPLGLACAGAGYAFRRQAPGRGDDAPPHARFFLLLAVVSLWLAMSPYLPLDLHRILYGLPVFDRLRAPARYLLIFDFSMAVLAGTGARAILSDWVALGQAAGRRLAWAALGCGAAVLALLFATAGWIGANRDLTVGWFEDVYARMPNAGLLLPSERLFDFLQWSVWLGNPRVAFAAALIAACVLWGGARVSGRLSARRAGWWALGLVLLDLTVFSATFWQSVATRDADGLASMQGLAEFRDRGRIYIPTGGQARSDRSMSSGITVIGGYSAYAMQRQEETLAVIDAGANLPLDSSSVEFVLPRAHPKLPRSDGYRQDVQIDHPIAIVETQTPRLDRRFIASKVVQGSTITVVSALEYAEKVIQNTTVGFVILTDAQGRAVRVPIRAGIETAEWALDRADVAPMAGHRKADVFAEYPSPDLSGGSYNRYLYSTRIDVPAEFTASSIELECYVEGVRWHVFRLQVGEFDFFDRFDLEHFSAVPGATAQRVVRNLGALPRARIAARARVTTPMEMLHQMQRSSFDARWEVLLEGSTAHQSRDPDERWKGSCGEAPPHECAAVSALLTPNTPEHLTVKTKTPADGWLVLADSWYPGWTATIDGTPVEILRANYVQRAVALPAGEHSVEFTYRPESVRAGSIATAISMAVALGALAGLSGLGARASSE